MSKKVWRFRHIFVVFSEYMNFTGFYGRFVFDKKVLYFPIMVFWPGNQARKSVWHLRGLDVQGGRFTRVI